MSYSLNFGHRMFEGEYIEYAQYLDYLDYQRAAKFVGRRAAMGGRERFLEFFHSRNREEQTRLRAIKQRDAVRSYEYAAYRYGPGYGAYLASRNSRS